MEPELIPLPFVVTSLSLGCFITEAEKKGYLRKEVCLQSVLVDLTWQMLCPLR